MTRPNDGQEKFEAIAYRMYIADFQLNMPDDAVPLSWEELDADEKFAWCFIASAGLREIAILDDFQKRAVCDTYRNRSPYPINEGETWESVTAGFFEWGYNEVFFQYNMPSDDASGLNV